MIRNYVLRALTTKEGWHRWGTLFDARYFESQDRQQIYQALRAGWQNYDGHFISQELLETLLAPLQPPFKGDLTALYALSIEESMAGATQALAFYKGEELVQKAANDILRGEPDFAQLGNEFIELDFALKATTENRVETLVSPAQDTESLLTEENQSQAFPTGLPGLDEQLDGGLWVGELGVIMAPPFKGKTHKMIHLGASALEAGIPLCHFTLEISGARTAIRSYQRLLHETRDTIRLNPLQTKERIEALDLPLWEIHDFSAGGLSVGGFRRAVLKFRDKCGDKSPLVVVDYLDLLTGKNYTDQRRHEIENVAESMRRVANEAGCGVWTGSQVNRAGYDAAVIKMEHIAESVSKVEKADVIISLNQSMAEEGQNEMRLYIAKARERVVTQPTVRVRTVTAHQEFKEVVA